MKLIKIKNYPPALHITYTEMGEEDTYRLSYEGLRDELTREEWEADEFISDFSENDRDIIIQALQIVGIL